MNTYHFEKLNLIGLAQEDTTNVINTADKAEIIRQASTLCFPGENKHLDIAVDPNKIQPVFSDKKQVVIPIVSGALLTIVRFGPENGYQPTCALYHITSNGKNNKNGNNDNKVPAVVKGDTLYKGNPIDSYATRFGAYKAQDGEYVFVGTLTKNNNTYSVRAIKINTIAKRDYLNRLVFPSFMLFWGSRYLDDAGMILAPRSIYQDTLIHASQQIGQFAQKEA